jgi:hypothetical protein
LADPRRRRHRRAGDCRELEELLDIDGSQKKGIRQPSTARQILLDTDPTPDEHDLDLSREAHVGNKRVFYGILISLAAFTVTPARADLALLSQDFYQGTGSKFQGVVTPTVFTHGPFPQTATNSITFDQDGMHVLGNVRGHDAATAGIFGANHNWTVSGYTVTFQIDAPEPYTYTADVRSNVNPFYNGTLTGPGTNIPLSGLVQSSSGVLQPGIYTFSQDTGTEGPLNIAPPENFQSFIQNAVLTVLPEPATISVLGIAAIGLLARGSRRRRTQRHP